MATVMLVLQNALYVRGVCVYGGTPGHAQRGAAVYGALAKSADVSFGAQGGAFGGFNGCIGRMYPNAADYKGGIRMDFLKGKKMKVKKCVCIVLDSVGIGALPDAARFGDEGSHTLGHVMEQTGIKLTNLCKLGLANIEDAGLPGRVDKPLGCYAKAAEKFDGKDTAGGHWENGGPGVGSAVSHVSKRLSPKS